jgi:hypothetical protein
MLKEDENIVCPKCKSPVRRIGVSFEERFSKDTGTGKKLAVESIIYACDTCKRSMRRSPKSKIPSLYPKPKLDPSYKKELEEKNKKLEARKAINLAKRLEKKRIRDEERRRIALEVINAKVDPEVDSVEEPLKTFDNATLIATAKARASKKSTKDTPKDTASKKPLKTEQKIARAPKAIKVSTSKKTPSKKKKA